MTTATDPTDVATTTPVTTATKPKGRKTASAKAMDKVSAKNAKAGKRAGSVPKGTAAKATAKPGATSA